MADLTTLRVSPLAELRTRMHDGQVSGVRGVSLRELPFLTMVSLRVGPGTDAFRRVAAVLGAPPSTACGEVTESGATSALWLGPDEWLVVSASREPSELVAGLRDALGDAHGAAVDVSANRTTLELTGPSARSVLEKGCPLDLHPRAFGPGRALGTMLASVPVVLWQCSESSYRLMPRASFAEYTAQWLLDAMSELVSPWVP